MYARIPIVVGIEVASARERVKGDALVADLGVEFLRQGRATPGTRDATSASALSIPSRTILGAF